MLKKRLHLSKRICRALTVLLATGTLLYFADKAGADLTLEAAATEGTDGEDTGEEGETATSADVMKKELGATSFWRWKKCYGGIDKTADDWDRYMIMETYGTPDQDIEEWNYLLQYKEASFEDDGSDASNVSDYMTKYEGL